MHRSSTRWAHCVECHHSVVLQMENYWPACSICLPIIDPVCIKYKALDPHTKGIPNTSFYIMEWNFVQDVDFLYSITDWRYQLQKLLDHVVVEYAQLWFSKIGDSIVLLQFLQGSFYIGTYKFTVEYQVSYEYYVEVCKHAGKWQRKPTWNVLMVQVSYRNTPYNLISKVRTTMYHCQLLKQDKLYNIGACHEDSCCKPLNCLAQEIGIWREAARTTTLLKMKHHKITLVTPCGHVTSKLYMQYIQSVHSGKHDPKSHFLQRRLCFIWIDTWTQNDGY